MAMVYVDRFLQSSPEFSLTTFNYKRVVLIALLLASKVWDDESFETPTFAKAFPSFSTVLLNELEKVFLEGLCYRLHIEKGEYANMYFRMRASRSQRVKTHHLRSLPLWRILDLQRGAGKVAKSELRDKSH
jgi:hypothetical protein